jgi:hypothetical protein
VTIARGNIAAVDHGRSIVRETQDNTLQLPDMGDGRWPIPSLVLPDATVTRRPEPDGPAVRLEISVPGEPAPETWTPVPDLLDSLPFDQHFVVETDNAGVSSLRFGDDQYGRRPFDAERVVARYRTGNGELGNIGRGTLVHLVAPVAVIPAITRIWQPLPASGGEAAETNEHVRQIAPEAFRAVQFRAVTEGDWEEMALRHPDVAAAKASFRWTGSWHTVRRDPSGRRGKRRLPGGGPSCNRFAQVMKAHLTRFQARRIRPEHPCGDLCSAGSRYPDLRGGRHFRGDVLAEVQRVLSNRACRWLDRLLLPLRPGFRLRRLPVAALSRRKRRRRRQFGRDHRLQALLGGGARAEKGAITMSPFEIPPAR